MPKLFVSGCSFSDYTLVKHNWGELLSDKLGMQYVHMNRGGGSNDRTWREIAWKILEGEITSDDVVIAQYTNLDRREFGATEIGHNPNSELAKEKFDTRIGTFYTTAFKSDSHMWQNDDWDVKLHNAYEHTGAISETYSLAHFYTQHGMFDSLCKQHHIKIIYMGTRYMPCDVEISGTHVFNEHHHMPVVSPDRTMLGHHPDHPAQDEYDSSHLSQYGHELLARHVEQYIVENGVLGRV